jgi:osmotically inducible lipoprotein OsmB
MKKIGLLLATGFLMVDLTGCASMTHTERTLTGAAVGGVIGNAVTGGGVLGTAAGAAAGAYVGSKTR